MYHDTEAKNERHKLRCKKVVTIKPSSIRQVRASLNVDWHFRFLYTIFQGINSVNYEYF